MNSRVINIDNISQTFFIKALSGRIAMGCKIYRSISPKGLY